MKTRHAGLLLALIMVVGWPAAAADRTESALARDVVAELTLARTDPQAYAAYVAAERARIRGGILVAADGRRWVLQEGARAYDEAIAFLRAQRPLGALQASAGLTEAARDHVHDQGPRGATGHGGSDGSQPVDRVQRHGTWEHTFGENISYGPDTARTIVIQLIVDDGVADRGHRSNIFHPGFHVVGVACGRHKQYGTMCVIDFAGAFSP